MKEKGILSLKCYSKKQTCVFLYNSLPCHVFDPTRSCRNIGFEATAESNLWSEQFWSAEKFKLLSEWHHWRRDELKDQLTVMMRRRGTRSCGSAELGWWGDGEVVQMLVSVAAGLGGGSTCLRLSPSPLSWLWRKLQMESEGSGPSSSEPGPGPPSQTLCCPRVDPSYSCMFALNLCSKAFLSSNKKPLKVSANPALKWSRLQASCKQLGFFFSLWEVEERAAEMPNVCPTHWDKKWFYLPGEIRLTHAWQHDPGQKGQIKPRKFWELVSFTSSVLWWTRFIKRKRLVVPPDFLLTSFLRRTFLFFFLFSLIKPSLLGF